MIKMRLIAASAVVLAFCPGADAGWRSPIEGAKPVLPATFMPQGWIVVGPAPVAPAPEASAGWSLPLVDRVPTAAEKAADLAPLLQEAILRIEPIYDPTRLDGLDTFPEMAVTAGTATMDNVFADRWRRAAADPTVDRATVAIALAWSGGPPLPCDAYVKRRPHGLDQPALDAGDCATLDHPPGDMPAEIAAGVPELPVFAAPLPGARLSSTEFWAARRAHVQAIQAELQRKWQAGAAPETQIGSR